MNSTSVDKGKGRYGREGERERERGMLPFLCTGEILVDLIIVNACDWREPWLQHEVLITIWQMIVLQTGSTMGIFMEHDRILFHARFVRSIYIYTHYINRDALEEN